MDQQSQPGGPQSQPSVSLVDVINVIADRAEPAIKLITAISERSLKAKEAAPPRRGPADFTEEGGELTPTQKVKRKVVAEKYQTLLDALYR